MYSCDTFALGKEFYSEGINYFAKNSDRPLGEAQPISFFAGGTHEPGETVSCTYITIPQVEKTYTVLGCRPYWIWGFEMGLNECGLFVGNEAEGSRCEAEEDDGLLGMDLLRLGLERAATCREAIQVITKLLEQYGQNGNASPLFDRRYENSFLMVDQKEIWLLETAGRQWVAKQIRDWAAISNCYSITDDYDVCSERMESYARIRRWLHPEEKINFSKAYTAPAVRQGYATPRWRRMKQLISSYDRPLTLEDVKIILRDHFEGEIIEPRWGGSYGCFVSICMHAMTWDSSQTTASLLGGWDEMLGPVVWYAASVPCCSVYLPIYWTGDVPLTLQKAGEFYEKDSLWWETERLAMLVSVDETRFAEQTRVALHKLEAQIYEKTKYAEKRAREYIENGQKEIALDILSGISEDVVQDSLILIQRLSEEISTLISRAGGIYGPRKEFLEAYAKRAKLRLLD